MGYDAADVAGGGGDVAFVDEVACGDSGGGDGADDAARLGLLGFDVGVVSQVLQAGVAGGSAYEATHDGGGGGDCVAVDAVGQTAFERGGESARVSLAGDGAVGADGQAGD